MKKNTLGYILSLLLVISIIINILGYKKKKQYIDRSNRILSKFSSVVKNLEENLYFDRKLQTINKDKINSKTLSWENFLLDVDNKFKYFQEKLDYADDLVSELNKHRTRLAKGIINLAKQIEYENNDRNLTYSLSTADEYRKKYNEIQNHVSTFYNQKQLLRDYLSKIAGILKTNISSFNSLDNDIYENNFLKIDKALKHLRLQTKGFADMLYELFILAEDKLNIKINLANVLSSTSDLHKNKIEKLKDLFSKDVTTIRDRFTHLAKVERDLKIKTEEVISLMESIKQKDEEIVAYNNDIDMKDSQIEELQGDKKNLISKIDSLYSKLDLDETRFFIGEVLKINSQEMYVVINKGTRDKLSSGDNLVIQRQGDIICNIIINTVYESISTAIIKPNYRYLPVKGDTVLKL